MLLVLLWSPACDSGEGVKSAALPAPVQTPSPEMTAPVRVQYYTYEVVQAYPHDPAAFTQGLVYLDGYLYESTGLEGQSSLRKVDLRTGQVLQKVDVPGQYFAEGLAILNRRIYQLTWQSRLGFIYDLDSFQMEKTFNYRGEGWGLTHDGRSLIMSDGSNKLKFLHPETLDLQREVEVYDGSRPVGLLNELEYVRGEILANIWQNDRLARIHPETGRVTGWINLSGLLPVEDRMRHVDVLNGIAYDEAGDRLFVTGKLWPKLFEIKLVQRRTTLAR